MHIISTHQFSDRPGLIKLFQAAEKHRPENLSLGQALGALFAPSPQKLEKTYYVLFYEPSTRTRFSFETAIIKLGSNVVSSESAAQFSSAIKGETLEDSIRVLAQYHPAAIILRHPERGAAARAVRALPTDSETSIINAGDGDGEHPTQSLLDLYTIWRELGRIDDLEIALVGDLRYGRTVHSLIHLLQYSKNIKLHLVSPDFLALPANYLQILNSSGMTYNLYRDIADLPSNIDVVYMTRLQLERFTATQLREIKSFDERKYYLNLPHLQKLQPESRILHPLPRVDEISRDIDADPRAAYFRQAGNGLPIRMALLAALGSKIYPFCQSYT